jgi:integrase
VNTATDLTIQAVAFTTLADGSVRNTLRLLKKIFNDAVDDDYLRSSPMTKKVKVPPRSKEQKGRALNPEEIRDLLAACGDEPATRLIVLTAILTGMRRGELFALRWEDVDWQKDVVQCAGPCTGSAASTFVPLRASRRSRS